MIVKAKKTEFKVGLYVIIITSIVIFCVVYIGIKKDLFSEKIYYYVISTTGENVERGIPVRLSGFKIGQVNDVNLDKIDYVKIEIKILEEYMPWFKQDSKIILVQGGFIGQTYLKLIPGSDESPVLSPGAIVKLDKVGGLDEIIAEAKPVLDDLKVIVANVKIITEQLVDEGGPVQNIITNLEQMSNDLRSEKGLVGYLTKDPRPVQKIDSLLTHGSDLVSNATLRMEDLEPMQKELTALITEVREFVSGVQDLRTDIDPAVSNVVEITNEIKKASKDLVRLRNQGEYTIRLGNELLQRIKQIWPISRAGDSAPPPDLPAP
ncbi:MAG: MlaD family protein [Thermodesulfobacteriota bacterium]|nr:MlaD family protein [Thermodesulfobacteriota bacterium]